METKHCKLDSIPMSVLKKLVPYIIAEITHVVNVSLSTGQFAIDWKCSCVNPLIKAMKLDRVKPSYRPVSNLSFISKLVVHCALNQFNTHCNAHNLMPEYQSAYRRYHSCETLLINLTNSILWAMEKQEVTSCILIDKSAAFDTIDRSILSEVLHHRFGISGTALSWYDSYLNDWQFYVKVRKTNSIKQPLWYGVPQGSCSGAILFTAYCSTIEDVISYEDGLQLNGFVDDHTINKSFKLDRLGAELETKLALQNCLCNISEWASKSHLKMNNSKMEYINFGSRKQLAKCSSHEINICGEVVQ